MALLQLFPNPGDLIPLAGMLTGVVAMVLLAVGAVKIFNGPVGQALARRIRGTAPDADPALLAEVAALREHLSELEHRLTESEERLDFAERLLARHHEPERLPGAGTADPRL